MDKHDVLVILPTAYGKSLVYQIIPPFVDYMEILCYHRTINNTSVVFVVSPLNALIRDQVTTNAKIFHSLLQVIRNSIAWHAICHHI